MKKRIVYLIDHVYSDENLDQNCWIHNKDYLSQIFDILFVVRTLKPSYIKLRANFKIKSFNVNESYNTILKEIEQFAPDVLHIFGPVYLGNALKFVQDLHGKCKTVQQYGGGMPQYYYNDQIDKLIIDEVHAPVFYHVPEDKIVFRNNCCDLNFFKPMVVAKKYDCIKVAGFYCSKGQDIVIDILKHESLSILFVGAQKSNLGEYSDEYIQTINLYNEIYAQSRNVLKVNFVDFCHPNYLPQLYNEAKIFTWGSRSSIENPITLTNRSVTEAVACGLPFVAFRGTFQHSNFVIDGRNAILVHSDDEYRNAVKRLLTDDGLRIKMSIESRKIAEDKLDFKVWHDEFLTRLYEEL